MNLLHIYGQSIWHDPVYIIGNRKALEDLKKAIEDALDKGEGKIEAFCNDGEGYYVIVKYDNSGWLNGDWARRAVPYTDEVAREKRENALWPWQPKELQKRGKS